METSETNVRSLLSKTDEDMKKHVEKLEAELRAIRTGRANPALLGGIHVECYGSVLPLKQVAAVSVPDARTIEIRPWDPGVLSEVEKALLKSDIGISPSNDGKYIRLNLPALTEERRKDLVKVVRKMVEEYRVFLRNERRHAIEKIKKSEKNKELSEDDRIRFENEIQKLTDQYIKKADEILASKEKEIVTV